MKYYLLLSIAIISVVSFVKAECDEKSQKEMNKCYKEFTKSIDLKKPVVNKKFCSVLNEHQDCLKRNACVHASPKDLTKIFETDIKNVFKIMFVELSYKYVCSHPYTATEEEEKCIAEFSDKDVDCGHPDGCKEMDKYVDCFKEAITKKCKNEELSQIYADATKFGFKAMLPQCA